MSNAKPMSSDRRLSAYYNQLLQFRELTPRQRRQNARMAKRAQFTTSGASGIPVRKPLARSAAARGVAT